MNQPPATTIMIEGVHRIIRVSDRPNRSRCSAPSSLPLAVYDATDDHPSGRCSSCESRRYSIMSVRPLLFVALRPPRKAHSHSRVIFMLAAPLAARLLIAFFPFLLLYSLAGPSSMFDSFFWWIIFRQAGIGRHCSGRSSTRPDRLSIWMVRLTIPSLGGPSSWTTNECWEQAISSSISSAFASDGSSIRCCNVPGRTRVLAGVLFYRVPICPIMPASSGGVFVPPSNPYPGRRSSPTSAFGQGHRPAKNGARQPSRDDRWRRRRALELDVLAGKR
jgi:hypothetical protein